MGNILTQSLLAAGFAQKPAQIIAPRRTRCGNFKVRINLQQTPGRSPFLTVFLHVPRTHDRQVHLVDRVAASACVGMPLLSSNQRTRIVPIFPRAHLRGKPHEFGKANWYPPSICRHTRRRREHRRRDAKRAQSRERRSFAPAGKFYSRERFFL